MSESGLVFVNQDAIRLLNERGIPVDEEYIQQKAIEKIQEMARKREK